MQIIFSELLKNPYWIDNQHIIGFITEYSENFVNIITKLQDESSTEFKKCMSSQITRTIVNWILREIILGSIVVNFTNVYIYAYVIYIDNKL